MTESESANWNFRMYRHNGPRPCPSLCTKYYRTLCYPCHFIHNAAHDGAKQLEGACGFDVEEIAVDIYYYFEHSTKRKGELRSFSEFWDVR